MEVTSEERNTLSVLAYPDKHVIPVRAHRHLPGHIGPIERIFSTLLGLVMAGKALGNGNHFMKRWSLLFMGGELLRRGMSGKSLFSTRPERPGKWWIKRSSPTISERSITIQRHREEGYQYWRDLEKAPNYRPHIQEVHVIDEIHSHWVAKDLKEWDMEIIDDRPNEGFSWKIIHPSSLQIYGQVFFNYAPGDKGTEVKVVLISTSQMENADLMASIIGRDPDQQNREDLRLFKQLMETGEISPPEQNLLYF